MFFLAYKALMLLLSLSNMYNLGFHAEDSWVGHPQLYLSLNNFIDFV